MQRDKRYLVYARARARAFVIGTVSIRGHDFGSDSTGRDEKLSGWCEIIRARFLGRDQIRVRIGFKPGVQPGGTGATKIRLGFARSGSREFALERSLSRGGTNAVVHATCNTALEDSSAKDAFRLERSRERRTRARCARARVPALFIRRTTAEVNTRFP